MSEYGGLLPDFLLVQSTPEYGRGVYTRKDLSAGVELIVSEPLAHVICSHWRGFHCDWCTETKSLKKCSRCKFVFYCSKECQKSDWEFHKIECKGISSISPQVPTDTVRLILRLLVNKTMANKMVLPRGMKWGLDLLTTNAPRYSEELKEILSHQIMGVKILTKDSSISFKMEDAFEIACKLVSNTFSLLNWEMNTIGSGVYLMPSLFNHSCNPNVIAIFDGFNLKLRTIRPVESGHQLFVSYVDLLETRERRCRHLQKYYLFTCACGRCSENYDESIDQQMVATSSSLSDEIQCKELYREGFKTIEDVKKLKKSNDWDSILDITTKFLKNHSSALGDYNVLIVKMREILMDSYIEFSEWSKSLDVARALIGPYEKYYHHYNPVIGLHYCKMAKLIQQISEDTPNLQESMTFFDKAVGILNVAFGASNPIVMETQGAMNDTGMELAKRSCNKQHC